MYLAGDGATAGRVRVPALEDISPELPDDVGERVLLALDCANARRLGPDPALLERAATVVDVDHHHDNTRFGAVNLVVADASSTAEIVRDLLGGARRAAYARDRRGAVRRPRHRHRPLPVREHDAEGAAARRGAGRGRRRRARHLPQVYETVQFAKLKLLARALDRAQLYEGGRLVVSYLLREGLRRRRGGGAVLGGDHRLPAPGRGRRDGGADPRAAEGRRTRRTGSRCGRAATRSTCPRSRARPAAAATDRRQGSRARTGRGDRRLPPRRVRRPRTARARRCRRGRVDPSGSSSPTSRRDRRRSRSSPTCGAERAPAPATPGRSTRSRPGCSCSSPGWPRGSRRASSGWTSATSRTST